MRFSITSKMFLVAAAALFLVPATPTHAQFFAGTGNSRIGTIGDIDGSRLANRVNRSFGLNLSTLGLFGDAEVFPEFRPPRPFIFSLPNFSSSQDFTGVSFNDYLERVAGSFGLSVNDYLLQFQFQNEVSAANPGFIPTFQQVIQAHQSDFLAGGGFLPFAPPRVPADPRDKPGEFTPIEPIFTTPLIPATGAGSETDTTTDTNDVANLATEIVDGTLNIDDSGALTLSTGNVLVESTSANQSAASAANVAVAPEPATLGLLTLGTGMMLGRRRR